MKANSLSKVALVSLVQGHVKSLSSVRTAGQGQELGVKIWSQTQYWPLGKSILLAFLNQSKNVSTFMGSSLITTMPFEQLAYILILLSVQTSVPEPFSCKLMIFPCKEKTVAKIHVLNSSHQPICFAVL